MFFCLINFKTETEKMTVRDQLFIAAINVSDTLWMFHKIDFLFICTKFKPVLLSLTTTKELALANVCDRDNISS